MIVDLDTNHPEHYEATLDEGRSAAVWRPQRPVQVTGLRCLDGDSSGYIVVSWVFDEQEQLVTEGVPLHILCATSATVQLIFPRVLPGQEIRLYTRPRRGAGAVRLRLRGFQHVLETL